MNKSLPNKWIRKAISDVLNNVLVDGIGIPIFDTRVSKNMNKAIPMHYILMTTQSNEVDKGTKCEWNWESNILLDIITSYELPGNPGSRVLADDILDTAKDLTKDLVLAPSSGLKILTTKQSFPNDLSTTTQNENIFRNFLRLEFHIV